jgi:hypothetical protein
LLISHFPVTEPPQGPFINRFEHLAMGQIPPVIPTPDPVPAARTGRIKMQLNPIL